MFTNICVNSAFWIFSCPYAGNLRPAPPAAILKMEWYQKPFGRERK